MLCALPIWCVHFVYVVCIIRIYCEHRVYFVYILFMLCAFCIYCVYVVCILYMLCALHISRVHKWCICCVHCVYVGWEGSEHEGWTKGWMHAGQPFVYYKIFRFSSHIPMNRHILQVKTMSKEFTSSLPFRWCCRCTVHSPVHHNNKTSPAVHKVGVRWAMLDRNISLWTMCFIIFTLLFVEGKTCLKRKTN